MLRGSQIAQGISTCSLRERIFPQDARYHSNEEIQMKETRYKFKAADFYALLDKQKYKCALTGTELTPENTTAEHILPLSRGGTHELSNIFLVDERVAKLKRNLSIAEVRDVAQRIVSYGRETQKKRPARKR